MKNRFGNILLISVQLSLLFKACSAMNVDEGATIGSEVMKHPLARLLFARFAALSSNSDATALRKLEDVADRTLEFGPGADWSCTAESNRGFDYDSCTLSGASKSVEGGCSWCPLGSSAGVCLRAAQAAVVNELENDHLLHLRCYNDNDTEKVIDEEATAFWDEAMSCFPHSKADCGGDHGKGDHNCIYCDVAEPTMGLCLSVDLWDNMIVAQALEDFDEDVSTGSQIRLDQVIHCSKDHVEGDKDGVDDDSLWSNRCGLGLIDSVTDEEACLAVDGCTVAENPFPGLFGTTSGMHCVSIVQEQALVWAIQVLRSTGWEEEMSSYT